MANSTVNLPSKSLVGRLASCRVVLWALETHGPRLQELLDEPVGKALPESLSTTFGPVVEMLVQVLTEARDLLIASDRMRRDQTAKATHYRGLRDAASAALSHNLVGLRDTFLGACGTEIAAQLGFALRTPQQPGELFEQAQHLVARLGDPELVLPEPRYKGILLDAAEMTAELQPLVDKLGETLEDLSREARLDESTKIAKDEMLHAYDRTFLWAARTAESLFRLVNLPEVAKRVRPSTRRPGLTDEVETQGPDTGPGDPQPGGAVASPDASTDDATENP